MRSLLARISRTVSTALPQPGLHKTGLPRTAPRKAAVLRTAMLRTAALAAPLIGVMLLVGAPAASATAPGRLTQGPVPALALAAPQVDVVDDADVLSDSDVTRITSAASRISQADRVVVHTTTSSDADLTDYLAEQGARVGWSGGAVEPGTLTVTVAPTARNMDLAFGDGLTELRNYQEQIYQAMSDRFRYGSWAQGLIDALAVSEEALSGQLTADPQDSADDGGSNTGWIVLGAGGVGLLGYGGVKSVARKRKERKEAEELKRTLDELSAQNATVVIDLRARLEQNGLLVPSIPDGPLQDQLELDLKAAEADLRSADVLSDPRQAAAELAGVSDAVGSLDRRIALLRKAPDWPTAWSREVDLARRSLQRLGELNAELTGLGAATVPIPPGSADLDSLESEVRTEGTTIEAGLGRLSAIAHDLTAAVNQADQQVAELRAAAERARQEELRKQQEAERERIRQQQQQQNRYGRRGGGSDLGFWIGVALGSSNRRRGGGGWGGGRGGGWGGGFGGGGGFSGSSGSRGGGGGRRGGGGTRSF